MRHNELCDYSANLLSDVCFDGIEPHVQSVPAGNFAKSMTTDDDAR